MLVIPGGFRFRTREVRRGVIRIRGRRVNKKPVQIGLPCSRIVTTINVIIPPESHHTDCGRVGRLRGRRRARRLVRGVHLAVRRSQLDGSGAAWLEGVHDLYVVAELEQLLLHLVEGRRVHYEDVHHLVGQELARVTDIYGSFWK